MTALVALAMLLPPHDESQLLYSTQVAWSDSGEPLITVGLMDEQAATTLSAVKGPLRVTVSGGGAAAVVLPAGVELTAQVEHGVPGRTRYRVVLEGHSGSALEAVREARLRWEKAGLRTEVVELGGVVSFGGRMLDNRRALVVEAGFLDTKEAAQARANAISADATLERPAWAFADPVTRAQGVVVAVDEEAGVRIEQRDLLTVEAVDGGPIEVKNVEVDKGFPTHKFETRRYRGAIILAVGKTGQLAVINRVGFEDMLKGIVPAEIFPTAPAAALDAQAISARGELFAQLGIRNIADPYLTCASQECQAYGGLTKEQASTNAAVERTRGQMLFTGDGRIVDSVYHADSGGHTEHNENVWAGLPNPTLRGRLDAGASAQPPWPQGTVPTDEALLSFLNETPKGYFPTESPRPNPVFRWVENIPRAKLDSLVATKLKVGSVTQLEVLERGVSGRAKKLRVTGQAGTADVEGELTIRRLFGSLKSAMFVIQPLPSAWRFVGGGHGHGVGMSQYGAMGMAVKGRSAADILAHYYLGSRVERVY